MRIPLAHAHRLSAFVHWLPGSEARFKTARYRAMHCLLYGNYIRVALRHNKQSIFEPHSAALAPLYPPQKIPASSAGMTD